MKHAFVIAGTHSNVGKTTVSTALMAALVRRGHRVQGFKVGPDFIDPGFHAAATGRPSRNLDGWMLDRKTNLELFHRAMRDASVAVIEGVMGLFDGSSGLDESGSTAEMAKWLDVPIVLVVDASAQARSVAALVHGFETFDSNARVSAVITNCVAGEGHRRFLEDAIRASCRAEPIGCLRKDHNVSLPERHLGLVTAPEVMDAAKLEQLADWVEAGVDLDRLLAASGYDPDIRAASLNQPKHIALPADVASRTVRIGVARDHAFCFYYQDNLELLEQQGAELIHWSPICDPLPSGLNGLYFGGGYPELHAAELSANQAAKNAIKEFATSGGMVYAECGGLMYLADAIIDTAGNEHAMAGVYPTRARMQPRLAALGYAEVEFAGDSGWLPPGRTARGHQFRYSEIDPIPEHIKRIYTLRSHRPGHESAREGYLAQNCLASYVHLYFLSNPAFSSHWLQACRESSVTT